MMTKICNELLHRVYSSVTAAVCLGKDERLEGVRLFDTLFGLQEPIELPESKQIHLICNHPEGRMTPTQEEIRNYQVVKAQYPHAQIHLHIYGEDIGFFDVDIDEILDYNGGNAC